jgi:TFIIF-interacting CTD phosphatase-like protein
LKANDENFTEIINKIKKKKISSSFVLPAQKEPKKTLILDLDETLIHSTFNKPVKYDF